MRVRADELRDAGADHGVVRFDFDVHAREQVVGDFAAVAVGAFGDEGVRAGAAIDEIDESDGGLAAGNDEGVAGGFGFGEAGGGRGGAGVFDFGDAGGELERGGGAVDAVGVGAAGAPALVGFGEGVEDGC